jgi:hypothetical protein
MLVHYPLEVLIDLQMSLHVSSIEFEQATNVSLTWLPT